MLPQPQPSTATTGSFRSLLQIEEAIVMAHIAFVLNGHRCIRISVDSGDVAQFGVVLTLLVIQGPLPFLRAAPRIGKDGTRKAVKEVEGPIGELSSSTIVGKRGVHFKLTSRAGQTKLLRFAEIVYRKPLNEAKSRFCPALLLALGGILHHVRLSKGSCGQLVQRYSRLIEIGRLFHPGKFAH